MPMITASAMTLTVSSLWEPYGLRSSPFFQDELKPTDEDHPVSLFVGREGELRRLLRRVVSDPATRSIVQGGPGVGKTSFVNRLKADLAAGGVATYEHPVRITSETSRASFIADVLRTLVRIRSASAEKGGNGRFWSRIVRLLEGEELRGGSVSVLGVGGGVSRGFVTPQAPADSLYEHLGEALRHISGELGGPVMLHVNNLENLTREGASQTALLLRDLRDYLLLPGAHWVFVGATGIEDDIFRVHPQVGGIFPAAETLKPLDAAEIQRLLELRYEHLRIPDRAVVEPISPADGARIYALYQGDLRNFLRLLGDAAERGLGLGGVRPMTDTEVLFQMAPEYQRTLRQRLGAGDFDHLAKLVAASAGSDPVFRVTDAASILHIAQPSASQVVERLLKGRAIRYTRSRGRSVYYRPTGEALVALGVLPDALLAAGSES